MDKNRENEPMKMNFVIERDDFVRAGEASSKIKKMLLQLGFCGRIIRRVAIATYEVEMNVVIHSWGGTLSVEINPENITIIAQDIGPGIPDIAEAMKEGFSTAPEKIREMGFGAGMGLPNMKNCSDEFFIDSVVNKGTTIRMIINS